MSDGFIFLLGILLTILVWCFVDPIVDMPTKHAPTVNKMREYKKYHG